MSFSAPAPLTAGSNPSCRKSLAPAGLVLDGRLIGERTEEVDLVELLKVARREFNEKDSTWDEGLLQAQWPALRQRLGSAMRQWIDLPAANIQVIPVNPCNPCLPVARAVPDFITIRPPAMLPWGSPCAASPSPSRFNHPAATTHWKP